MAQEARATITPRRIIITRVGRIAREFPKRRKAVVVYPAVSGLSDPAVLGRVRALLRIENAFGSSLSDYRSDTWLDEFGYKVNYNRNHLLDITFHQSGVAAYPDSHEKHFLINLKTGNEIKAADVFHEERLDELTKLVASHLQREIMEHHREVVKDPNETEESKKLLYEALEALTFEKENLDSFSINREGVTFLYDPGFPHVIKALEPGRNYFFTYAELKTFIKSDGPLGQFIR